MMSPENENEMIDNIEGSSELEVVSTKMVKKMMESEYKRYKYEIRGGRLNKSEVEKYLNEETEDDNGDFNILEWWKLNGHRFPVLA